MRIVVIGGSGLVGAKLVSNDRHRGHEVLATSPRFGVNTITGEGLAEAVAGHLAGMRKLHPGLGATALLLQRPRCAKLASER